MTVPDARVSVEGSDAVLFALGAGLTALSVFNYATSTYGGSMLAGIGAVLTFAFVLLD
ncbi:MULTISPECIES: hypothetical protein [Halorussus]|uniref:hypothetical protein n=1 Tax=Halorussus TaxID=1070314 RepID=UPI00209CD205|nr:hypothetical protein [Halorussus vallis]USZ77480.1 hypothetical protein NGM07_09130 [Halorussus vallis]